MLLSPVNSRYRFLSRWLRRLFQEFAPERRQSDEASSTRPTKAFQSGSITSPARLTVDLIPRSTWGRNVRTLLPWYEWDRLRRLAYRKANYRCEICSGQGPEHPVECHEIWDFDDHRKIQRLVALAALCPACHQVKHFGRSERFGKGDLARRHLRSVNGWSRAQAESYLQSALNLSGVRSKADDWTLDLDILAQYDVDLAPVRERLGQSSAQPSWSGLVPAYWVETEASCWKCQAENRVVALGADLSAAPSSVNASPFVLLSYVEGLPAELRKEAGSKYPRFREGYSQAARKRYWMNHCDRCRVCFGDLYLHALSGGAFFDPEAGSGARAYQLIRAELSLQYVFSPTDDGEGHEAFEGIAAGLESGANILRVAIRDG